MKCKSIFSLTIPNGSLAHFFGYIGRSQIHAFFESLAFDLAWKLLCFFWSASHKKTQEVYVHVRLLSETLFAPKWLVTNILALSKGEEYNQPTSLYMSCGDTYPRQEEISPALVSKL